VATRLVAQAKVGILSNLGLFAIDSNFTIIYFPDFQVKIFEKGRYFS
jgi:hypothetical protein